MSFINYCMENFSEILTWGGEIKENNCTFEVDDDGNLLTFTDFKNLKQIIAKNITEMENKLIELYGDDRVEDL